MIEEELSQAIEFVSSINDKQPPQTSLAFWHAAIMSYARCFSSAWGRGTQLEAEHVNSFDPNAEQFHARLMELRNEYVAHAGNHTQEVSVVVVSLAPDSQPRAVEAIGYGFIATMGPSMDECKAFVALCKGLKDVVDDMRLKAEAKLLETYLAKNINELYKKSIR
jgi:hypothetical protein